MKLSNADISAVTTINIADLSPCVCTCKKLVCDCRNPEGQQQRQPDRRLHFAGTATGQFFVLEMDNISQQFRVSKDLCGQTGHPLIKIMFVEGLNRVITVHQDSLVSVFRVNFANDALQVSKIYSGYPCGSFYTTGTLISSRNNYLVMYGKFPTPCFFDLNRSRPVQ